jgi:hypothetical protein
MPLQTSLLNILHFLLFTCNYTSSFCLFYNIYILHRGLAFILGFNRKNMFPLHFYSSFCNILAYQKVLNWGRGPLFNKPNWFEKQNKNCMFTSEHALSKFWGNKVKRNTKHCHPGSVPIIMWLAVLRNVYVTYIHICTTLHTNFLQL